MKRMNDDAFFLFYIINDCFLMASEGIYVVTTFYYIIKQNWICVLGLIPFLWKVNYTMKRAEKTFIALCRSLEKFDEAKNVNSSEVVSGGVSIRALDSAEFAEETNIEN